MRVLTFNSHQPYVHLLSTSLPWTFGVVTPRLATGKSKFWDVRIRPLPDNVRLYDTLRVALEDSSWDWILLHNVNDLLDTRQLCLPRVYVVHGTLSGRLLQDGTRVDRESYLAGFRTLVGSYGCRVVYISALKQSDWGLPGEVIPTAINPALYGGYRGDQRAVLQVSNHLRERGAILGWKEHQEVCSGLPCMVLGNNPGLPESRHAESWDDLKGHYRAYRVYLHTALHPYEDGYNLALLEAMATGMPIATLEHPTSPIEDGVQGVAAPSAAELRPKVLRLLEDLSTAVRMGQEARRKLEQTFRFGEFQSSWKRLASSLTRRS